MNSHQKQINLFTLITTIFNNVTVHVLQRDTIGKFYLFETFTFPKINYKSKNFAITIRSIKNIIFVSPYICIGNTYKKCNKIRMQTQVL